jgi:hydroxymethylpyrimidine pyrophosphatase-like HAD family hydrolase
MRYVALATDYDGTLAEDGRVSDATLQSLQRFRQSGRKLILITGRELNDLQSIFSNLNLFDRVVAENGALLYDPSTRETKLLAPPPKPALVEALTRRGIQPLGIGQAIVATWQPHETEVLQVIRELGLELQVIFNKGAVMVLPSGVNKRSGLHAALGELAISRHNVVGVGDAENDHAFLEFCECAAAVANAHEAVKETADFTTRAGRGDGVSELIEMILSNNLDDRTQRRCVVPLGSDESGEVCTPSVASSILVCGASGSGKSTFVAGLLETLLQREYQVCVIDPEGDYESFPGTISLGNEKHAPLADEVLQVLASPSAQLVVNLMGIAVDERPAFFDRLLPRILEMRMTTGRPHWLVVDEAHHMLPREWAPASAALTAGLGNLVMITVHPDHLAASALTNLDVVLAVGPAPERVLGAFSRHLHRAAPNAPPTVLEKGEILAWFPEQSQLRRLRFRLAQADLRRHKRNYAHGELGEDRSFYFRGPEEKLNLRAQNLDMFLQLADGVDDDTWLYHLNRGDYSKWVRDRIKDEPLATEIDQCRREWALDPRASRQQIRAAIEKRYTAPA